MTRVTVATVGGHPSRPGWLALTRPDGSVSSWLSRLQGGAEGTVVFALDETGDGPVLWVSGPRHLFSDEIAWIAQRLARQHQAIVRFAAQG
jgi:hypothetical protein